MKAKALADRIRADQVDHSDATAGLLRTKVSDDLLTLLDWNDNIGVLTFPAEHPQLGGRLGTEARNEHPDSPVEGREAAAGGGRALVRGCRLPAGEGRRPRVLPDPRTPVGVGFWPRHRIERGPLAHGSDSRYRRWSGEPARPAPADRRRSAVHGARPNPQRLLHPVGPPAQAMQHREAAAMDIAGATGRRSGRIPRGGRQVPAPSTARPRRRAAQGQLEPCGFRPEGRLAAVRGHHPTLASRSDETLGGRLHADALRAQGRQQRSASRPVDGASVGKPSTATR